MGRFSMWFANLMRGRYGMDQLNRALIIVALIFIVINFFFHMRIINWIAVVLLIYIYCRMFSRNINARAAENQRYLRFAGSISSKFGRGRQSSYGNGAYGSYSGANGYGAGRKSRPKKDKDHKIMKCPSCGEKLRVPKGVGKINITCPHCRTKFTKKV